MLRANRPEGEAVEVKAKNGQRADGSAECGLEKEALTFQHLVHHPGRAGGAFARTWAGSNTVEFVHDILDQRLLNVRRIVVRKLRHAFRRGQNDRLRGKCRIRNLACGSHDFGAVTSLKAGKAPGSHAVHAGLEYESSGNDILGWV
ncbi:MAG: hypothetical protein M3Q32_11895 [Pseudomonadota bacterium]|nr:hypothetical protein [Pseudomonadota bacterium]